ncbi:MAG: DNA polymerase III subunit gamma/tau [Gammaproteobacteria bacterium]|nr:DNA polymerase III subunit gamma/tau [Gammaproteobacteria bacterium]
MSYQVLARKWRPRTFTEMVGQEHVLRALVNALDHDRLHHAYLFTGTRGVGKTTIARVLAKALNCEQGVSSKPCGVCSSCREIDEGRFVDLIEVDAASRTKVEDTRDLLDYAQYAPTRGRFKVYLIDEVHMLSKHSFNALLKTLEEPPPHVKFLLATTDPQRLPVTILSRCLQFNLKHLPAELIARHLARILEQEGVAAEPGALAQIARAAAGSVRDSLSLLDQAIAYGGGRVIETDVRAMLGTIEQGYVIELLEALAAGDGAALLQCVQRVAEHTFEFTDLLDELISALQRIALAQLVPAAADDSRGDAEQIAALARRMSREDVQLYYQIAVLGRRDLPHVPEHRSGFEMILLRMLAFRPAGAGEAAAAPAVLRTTPAAGTEPPPRRPGGRAAAPAAETAPVSPPRAMPAADSGWGDVAGALGLQGMARELAANCVLLGREGDAIRLMVDKAHAHLYNKTMEERLQQALSRHYGAGIRLSIEIGEPEAATPARIRQQQERDRMQAAITSLENDAEVKTLKETFNARIVPETVEPLD